MAGTASARWCTLQFASGPGRAGRWHGRTPPDKAAKAAAAINAAEAAPCREIMRVGHDYDIHPMLGAADRRPQRIAHVGYLDCGMPQNGVPALVAVPNHTLRAADGSGPTLRA
ncbi:hypothetical protein [Streptomyces bullii]|uniref:Uncharacterized protein n=1 Tax=Streptomyces bullii TaxID=349910 RepID=A0ABW0UVL4_9ACTN